MDDQPLNNDMGSPELRAHIQARLDATKTTEAKALNERVFAAQRKEWRLAGDPRAQWSTDTLVRQWRRHWSEKFPNDFAPVITEPEGGRPKSRSVRGANRVRDYVKDEYEHAKMPLPDSFPSKPRPGTPTTADYVQLLIICLAELRGGKITSEDHYALLVFCLESGFSLDRDLWRYLPCYELVAQWRTYRADVYATRGLQYDANEDDEMFGFEDGKALTEYVLCHGIPATKSKTSN